MGLRAPGIVLIGQRRAGKTTVGRLLAEATGRTFIDLDALVGEMTGLAPAAWINAHGMAAFRAAELRAVAAAVVTAGAVIAAGGGTVLDAANAALLSAAGVVVYLRVDPWILARRAAQDADARARPPLTDAGDAEPFVLHVARDDAYRRVADVIVDATPSPGGTLVACRRALDRARSADPRAPA